MVKRAFWMLVSAVLTTTVLSCGPVLAQGYPDKPIKLVVPYPPGASTDLVSRTLAQKMSESMGQPIIVENRGGAGGQIGVGLVARAAPDGYTIVLGTSDALAAGKFTNKAVTYDAVNDLTPIIAAVEMPIVLAVNASVPVNNAKEFVEYVKKNPDKISFGSPGRGSLPHLAGELLKLQTGIEIVHVPYRGTGQAMQDLLSGQLTSLFMALSSAIPQVRTGKIRILGLVEAKRQPSAPDIRTIGESIPGFAMRQGTIGFYGPAGLPAPIVARLNAEFLRALRAPDVFAKLEASGLPVIGSSAEELAIALKDDVEIYRKLTATAGIKPE